MYNSKHNDDDDGDGDEDRSGDGGGDYDNNHSSKGSNKDSRTDRNIPNSCSSKDDNTTKKDTTNYIPNIYLLPNNLDCRYTNTYLCNNRRSNLCRLRDYRNGEYVQCKNNRNNPIRRKRLLLWYWLHFWFHLSKEYLQVPKLPLPEHLSH